MLTNITIHGPGLVVRTGDSGPLAARFAVEDRSGHKTFTSSYIFVQCGGEFSGESGRRAMTELKRRLGSFDLDTPYCAASVKRHKADGSISARERKEKIGEKVAALQQLVSPFGKTDTASVLLEATGYIKFLQDQVQVLSAPYLHSRPSGKLQEATCYSLRSRGLCLVPVEWTLKLGQSNGADMWAPSMRSGTSS
ncbi:hypothetical protein H6P81_013158 [Aristolochia fimbriata]|uniref:BHLH domain-containing protein n=1 Tax=Aristolochia fimbriata TaxID=158543 RepID=A0AAV7EDV3_ARIFI|nr:hypothetical protein H6P81_013158 [Aristolochia fimbriata]